LNLVKELTNHSHMTTVSVHQAKTHLSRLLRQVMAGEEVEITNNKVVVARIVPPADAASKPLLGRMKGEFELGDAFFEPLPEEELRAWGMI
jgi:prevent-host-death family protein